MPRLRLKSLQVFISLLVICAVLLPLMGCSRKQNAPVEGGPRGGANMITIKGSDTMVHLVSNWAEEFMKASPGVQVSVTGGGTGTGIAALMNGTTDLAAASRDLSEKEKAQAQQKKLTLQEIPVGMDGLTVITNPTNPVENLTMAQLKDIFTGKISNWKEVGGPNQPILVYSRESSSGTYAFFQEHVLQKEDYAQSARLMPATSGIIEAVASDQGGIGYVGLGYAQEAENKIKLLGIRKDANAPVVTPTEATIKDKSYPIARELFLIAPSQPAAQTQKFVTYATSKEGQTIVQKSGYIPVQQQ